MATKRGYLSLFKDKRLYLFLLLDILLIASLYVSITAFGEYAKTKSTAFQGLNLNNPQSGDTAKTLSQLEGLQSFLIIFVIVVIIFIIATITLYSLLQGVIWNDIKGNKQQKLLGWIPYQFVILLPSLLYLIIALIINLLVGFLISLLPQSISTILSNIVSLLLLIIFAIFINSSYHNYSTTHKMWASIGDGLKNITTHKKNTFFIALYALVLFILVSILSYPLQFVVSQTTIYFISVPFYLLIFGIIRLLVNTQLSD